MDLSKFVQRSEPQPTVTPRTEQPEERKKKGGTLKRGKHKKLSLAGQDLFQDICAKVFVVGREDHPDILIQHCFPKISENATNPKACVSF